MTHSVLVAEDDPFLLQTIAMVLQEHDLHVIEARDGEQAINLIRTEHPDIVLLDLLMPKVDGYSVLKQMREDALDIPVVIISNVSDDMDQQRCRELGCVDYLVKSDMDEDEIFPQIKRYLPSV